MSNTPNNPFDPNEANKGPWLYSGANQPTPGYVPPPEAVVARPAVAPPAPPVASAPKVVAVEGSKPAGKANDDASLASIIDTIEAIIIALIIALTFRAFVAEAFVIPTGSMAPTLLGAHFNVVCPKCGYVFSRDASLQFQYSTNPAPPGEPQELPRIVNFGGRGELTSNRTIPVEEKIRCPNCEYTISPEELPQYLGLKTNYNTNRLDTHYDVPFAWANNGDRIFVLKYLYAIFEPSRFDVIVFKEPMAAQDNFIKRLIGLPNETIEIVNGDIFVGPPGKTEAEDLQMARKPVYVQKNVWQLIYDNDYYPTDQLKPRADGSTWVNPWVGGGETAGQWRIDNPVLQYGGSGAGTLQFAVREPYSYNVLGYNDDQDEGQDPRGVPLVYCGDLHLETEWTPQKADDSIAMTVGQTRNEYRATWSAKGGVHLERFNTGTGAFEAVAVTLLEQPPAMGAGHSYNVALDNVDRVVRLFIDNKLVVEHVTPWTAKDAIEEQGKEDSTAREPLKPEIRIDVGGVCTLSHLKLSRDLYYTQVTLNPGSDNSPGFIGGPGTATMGHPLTLGPDEFFAMGDNSRRSHDGRSWAQVYPGLDDLGTRRGVVPRRYLLGKAIFVYWPAGFRFTSNDGVPVLSNIPLVPNVGDMRLIR